RTRCRGLRHGASRDDRQLTQLSRWSTPGMRLAIGTDAAARCAFGFRATLWARMAPPLISLSDLAHLYGVPPDLLRDELALRKVRARPVRGEDHFAVPGPLFGAEELRALRRRAREMRMGIRTSRNWVAGYPELVAEWHPTKNIDLFPDEVSFGSHRRIWWRCPKGSDHEWIATPNKRTGSHRGCPFCAGQRVSVTNSLATTNPGLAGEWHSSKNGKLTPRDVTAASQRVVWWKCARDAEHEWRCAPADRFGCPYCDGKLTDAKRSLAALHPELAGEWDRTLNGALVPEDVLPGSKRRVWWRCARDPEHAWITCVKHRARRGQGCPHCAKSRRS
ncbi:MAG: zinc-ribbon domain-containing protein, partial [Thermoanaerobaculia bacterium]